MPLSGEYFFVSAVDLDIKEYTEKSFCILGELRSIYEALLEGLKL